MTSDGPGRTLAADEAIHDLHQEEEPMSSTITAARAARQEMPAFRGRLIGPEDADYEQARTVYNAMIDRRPALIACCADAQDVADTVTFASAHELPLAIRGGGAQRRRPRHVRGRCRRRLVAAQGHRGRPWGAHGSRRRRLHLGRSRSRHRRARPRDPERDHLEHRRRRAHARRRSRPSHATLRADDRQPARGGARARERRDGAGQRR